MNPPKHTDVLIIGSGLAGATAAISAAEEGKNVTIITKSKELKSGNTPYAQGGIVYKSDNDTPKKLKDDIIKAGHNDSWEIAVDELCDKEPELHDMYDLRNNKGYGTKKHIQGIHKYGLSRYHRKTFGICKKY